MDTASYPDEGLAAEIAEHTVAARPNILQERELAKRYEVRWTPSVLFLDGDGKVQHRFLGFHPPDEFAAQIHLARGHAHFAGGRYEESRRAFQTIVDRWPRTDPAPEALYWIGVNGFKLTKSTDPIYAACKDVVAKYPGSLWAKKLGFVTRYQSFDPKTVR